LSVIIVSAADAKYWELLDDLIRSVRAGELARGFAFGVLDVGLLPEQRRRLEELGVTVAEPGWDFAVPWREKLPDHARSLHARPFLPRYFPGYEIYLWIDADAWVQDDRVLAYFIDAARAGKLAIVPETDRGYWTLYKPPKLWGRTRKPSPSPMAGAPATGSGATRSSMAASGPSARRRRIGRPGRRRCGSPSPGAGSRRRRRAT